MITSPFERELKLLNEGELGIVQQLVESSNIGFIVDLELDGDYGWAVYKPELGEQPLWDFPPGLYKRERAAFVISEFLGWNIVPPTVIMHDAPAGVGSVQWFIENNGEHYFHCLTPALTCIRSLSAWLCLICCATTLTGKRAMCC